jgi:hypothetical protein
MSESLEEILFYSDEDLLKRRTLRGPQGDPDWGVTFTKDSSGKVYFGISNRSYVNVGTAFELQGYGTQGTFIVNRDDARGGWVLLQKCSLAEQILRDARICEIYYACQRSEESNLVHKGLYFGKRLITMDMIRAAVSRESKRRWKEKEAEKTPTVLCPIDDPDFV